MSSETESTVPMILDGAKVLRSARVSLLAGAHTRGTNHVVNAAPLATVSHLAIAQYDDELGFYLFYCDLSWAVLADTWHETASEAERQAEFEYAGVSGIWETIDAV